MLYSLYALDRHTATCSRISPDTTHLRVVGFPPPRDQLEASSVTRPALAYYCECGSISLYGLKFYVHLFQCAMMQELAGNERAMTTARAVSLISSRKFRLSPRTIIQVCSSCFEFRTVDNWSMELHWPWCVTLGAREREISQRGNRWHPRDTPIEPRLETDSQNDMLRNDRRQWSAHRNMLEAEKEAGARAVIQAQEAELRAEAIERTFPGLAGEEFEVSLREEMERVLWREDNNSANGERGSDASEKDFDSESSGESYSSPGQTLNAPAGSEVSTPWDSELESPGSPIVDDTVAEFLHDDAVSEGEFEVSGLSYRSDPGIGTEWETEMDTSEQADGEEVNVGPRWHDNEADLEDWATKGRNGDKNEMTSDGSLDSRLQIWGDEVTRGEKRQREEADDSTRARRRRMEQRARREKRQPESSDTDGE